MTLQKMIDKHKAEYKSLGKIFCPYINLEVEFTSSGFNHLIWKSAMGMRSYSVIKERLESIGVLKEIISKSGTLQEYENNEKEFLCFIAIIENKKYKVVISKAGDGKYKFVSVIPKWKTGIRDDRLK